MPQKQLDEFARTWILGRSLTLAKSINATTLDALRATLAEGLAEGESIRKLTQRIEGYFAENAKSRAEMISRTEVITASNEGALHRYETEGINKVEFYPAPDACAVCLGFVGEYDATSSHGIITEQTHPNCRCVWLPVV